MLNFSKITPFNPEKDNWFDWREQVLRILKDEKGEYSDQKNNDMFSGFSPYNITTVTTSSDMTALPTETPKSTNWPKCDILQDVIDNIPETNKLREEYYKVFKNVVKQYAEGFIVDIVRKIHESVASNKRHLIYAIDFSVIPEPCSEEVKETILNIINEQFANKGYFIVIKPNPDALNTVVDIDKCSDGVNWSNYNDCCKHANVYLEW
jgi:hypothetical protein